jgi:phosphoenolpyruvate carboxykinase (GTP)
LPARGAIDTGGIDVDEPTMKELCSVSADDWRKETAGIAEFFGKFGDRLPREIKQQTEALARRLNGSG